MESMGGLIFMFEEMNEGQAKQQILELVKEYCDTFHNKKGDFQTGR